MSWLNWFSGKPGRHSSVASSGPRAGRGSGLSARDKAESLPPPKPEAGVLNRAENRKVRRHARREQLYIAVREAMTRSGVLASSYKFKVLSLDQRGDEFLVMVDATGILGSQREKLEEIETAVMQTAKARFEITVSSVYWRTGAKAASDTAKPGPQPRTVASLAAVEPVKKPSSSPYEPIQQEEVVAFKKALASASAPPASTTDAAGKSRSGLHSYTLLTGFEDTEMPESPATPALSATQYGDLN